jgi:hypothetical protein
LSGASRPWRVSGSRAVSGRRGRRRGR